MIASLATAATGSSSTAGTESTNNLNEAQDRFLKLLVTQMKNQDPMNPMDNAAVTTQMAQISTVSGIAQLNDTLKSLLGQGSGAQALQGAALAGHQVLVPGNALELAGSAGGASSVASAGFELAAAADRVTLTVQDSAGRTLKQSELGAQSAGVHAITWDGLTTSGERAVDGRYTFKIDAVAANKALPVTALALGRVNGVSPGGSGLQLDLGALGLRAYSDVKRIQ